MDSKESIPPAYVAWLAGTINLLTFLAPIDCLKIPAQYGTNYIWLSFLRTRERAQSFGT